VLTIPPRGTNCWFFYSRDRSNTGAVEPSHLTAGQRISPQLRMDRRPREVGGGGGAPKRHRQTDPNGPSGRSCPGAHATGADGGGVPQLLPRHRGHRPHAARWEGAPLPAQWPFHPCILSLIQFQPSFLYSNWAESNFLIYFFLSVRKRMNPKQHKKTTRINIILLAKNYALVILIRFLHSDM